MDAKLQFHYRIWYLKKHYLMQYHHMTSKQWHINITNIIPHFSHICYKFICTGGHTYRKSCIYFLSPYANIIIYLGWRLLLRKKNFPMRIINLAFSNFLLKKKFVQYLYIYYWIENEIEQNWPFYYYFHHPPLGKKCWNICHPNNLIVLDLYF